MIIPLSLYGNNNLMCVFDAIKDININLLYSFQNNIKQYIVNINNIYIYFDNDNLILMSIFMPLPKEKNIIKNIYNLKMKKSINKNINTLLKL